MRGLEALRTLEALKRNKRLTALLERCEANAAKNSYRLDRFGFVIEEEDSSDDDGSAAIAIASSKLP